MKRRPSISCALLAPSVKSRLAGSVTGESMLKLCSQHLNDSALPNGKDGLTCSTNERLPPINVCASFRYSSSDIVQDAGIAGFRRWCVESRCEGTTRRRSWFSVSPTSDRFASMVAFAEGDAETAQAAFHFAAARQRRWQDDPSERDGRGRACLSFESPRIAIVGVLITGRASSPNARCASPFRLCSNG